MGEITVKKLKEIGNKEENIKEFKKYKKKQNKTITERN